MFRRRIPVIDNLSSCSSRMANSPQLFDARLGCLAKPVPWQKELEAYQVSKYSLEDDELKPIKNLFKDETQEVSDEVM